MSDFPATIRVAGWAMFVQDDWTLEDFHRAIEHLTMRAKQFPAITGMVSGQAVSIPDGALAKLCGVPAPDDRP